MKLIFTGTSANDVHFQSYLLEEIVRWNDERATAALSTSSSDGRSFSGKISCSQQPEQKGSWYTIRFQSSCS